MENLYGIKQVQEKLSVSRATIYNLINAGRLAKPKKVTSGSSRWLESDIQKFIESL